MKTKMKRKLLHLLSNPEMFVSKLPSSIKKLLLQIEIKSRANTAFFSLSLSLSLSLFGNCFTPLTLTTLITTLTLNSRVTSSESNESLLFQSNSLSMSICEQWVKWVNTRSAYLRVEVAILVSCTVILSISLTSIGETCGCALCPDGENKILNINN